MHLRKQRGTALGNCKRRHRGGAADIPMRAWRRRLAAVSRASACAANRGHLRESGLRELCRCEGLAPLLPKSEGGCACVQRMQRMRISEPLQSPRPPRKFWAIKLRWATTTVDTVGVAGSLRPVGEA